MAQGFIVKDKRVDNQKSKPAKGKGVMIERLPVGDEKRNRTARDKGEQLFRNAKGPEKYISVEVKGRENS